MQTFPLAPAARGLAHVDLLTRATVATLALGAVTAIGCASSPRGAAQPSTAYAATDATPRAPSPARATREPGAPPAEPTRASVSEESATPQHATALSTEGRRRSASRHEAHEARDHGSDDRHVYRFDFVLTAEDGDGEKTKPSTTAFTLNLSEFDKGSVVVGKNVVLSGPVGAKMASPPPRRDVGLKVEASFRSAGDDVVLDVESELSSLESPSTLRKLNARGKALAQAGKPALVSRLEDGSHHYRLDVTATKLR